MGGMEASHRGRKDRGDERVARKWPTMYVASRQDQSALRNVWEIKTFTDESQVGRTFEIVEIKFKFTR